MNVLITCRGRAKLVGKEQERQDIFAPTSHASASRSPQMHALFVHNSLDFPLSMIRQSGVFCVNFLPKERHGEIAFCSRHAGEHIDKFRETQLTKSECEAIDCPRISEAEAHLECELVQEQIVGDHVLLVGKVIRSSP